MVQLVKCKFSVNKATNLYKPASESFFNFYTHLLKCNVSCLEADK